MSKYFGLLLLTSSLSFSQAFAAGEETAQPEEKIYVTHKSFHVNKKAIVVRTEEGIFKARALHSDEDGFFVKQEELEKAPNMKKGCKKCWKKNKKNKEAQKEEQEEQAGQPKKNCKKCWKMYKKKGWKFGKKKNWKADKETTPVEETVETPVETVDTVAVEQ